MKNVVENIAIPFIFFTVIVLFSCNSPVSINGIKTISTNNTIIGLDLNNAINIQQPKYFGELEGFWFYSDYIDSTIKNKKIFDYIDDLSRDRYEITFSDKRPDTAFIKGYRESYFVKLTKLSDNQYMIYGDTLQLVSRDGQDILEYIQPEKPKKIYTKKDLKITDIKKYFAENIFSGVYHDIITNKKVIFSSDFSITGLEKVTSFRLSDGISEYSDGMDILSFKGLSGFYGWQFNGDTLIINEAFSVEDENGPAGFKLGEVKFTLIKQD